MYLLTLCNSLFFLGIFSVQYTTNVMWITKKRVIHNPIEPWYALLDLASGHQSFLFLFFKEKAR